MGNVVADHRRFPGHLTDACHEALLNLLFVDNVRNRSTKGARARTAAVETSAKRAL
ncbi:hypothetical protein CNECB9_2250010 [Cupriavidus necator]|uniref:Uncharacterized protein n=1 Tax=Cupriavidus necator TaxID=106590 RepID=A0A1K0ICR5_CUPNE|nr:hypothetical protein CNECB9_2250010 [Cupriavidus necator]SPC11566.1 hypothetical protein CT19431_40265 [Cupriavidus taiwanensis]